MLLRFHVKSIGECGSSKTAIFDVLGAFNFVDLLDCSLQKCKSSLNSKLRASDIVEIAYFETLMISRKKSEGH